MVSEAYSLLIKHYPILKAPYLSVQKDKKLPLEAETQHRPI